jgi:hypothetical protein
MVRIVQDTKRTALKNSYITTARRTFDFVFAEGGLVACKYGVDLPIQSFVGFIGEGGSHLLIQGEI